MVQHQPTDGGFQHPPIAQAPPTPFILLMRVRSTAIIQAHLNKYNPGLTDKNEEAKKLVFEYPQYRAIARDGDAGWRAIAFSYFEVLLKSTKSNTAVSVAGELERLKRINLEIEISGAFTDRNFRTLSTGIETLLQNMKGGEGFAVDLMVNLELLFNNISKSNPIINYVRLLATWHLKRNFSTTEVVFIVQKRS